MRPVRLELQGFSTFREPTVVDFADVELLALVGPTGAGKSSVIDAITFALYGSASRYGERDVAPVVNQLSTEARVRFVFEVGGVTYAATRVVRRTAKGATTKEARFERGDTLLAGDAKGVTEQATALLGLDFVRFNKTVVLPQGRFAEFLHDKPADRQELLRELFGFGVYERVGRTARDRASRLQAEADAVERAMGGVDVSPERGARLAQLVASSAEARERVAALADEATGLERELVEHRGRVQHLDAQLGLVRAVEVPAEVHELGRVLADAEADATAARLDREAARAVLRTATEAAAAGPSRLEIRQLLDQYERRRVLATAAAEAGADLQHARAAHGAAVAAADEARAGLARARDTVDQARVARDLAESAVVAAGDRVALRSAIAAHDQVAATETRLAACTLDAGAADERWHDADRHHAAARAALAQLEQRAPAAALAEHLHVGEACPVCAQPVRELPAVDAVGAHELAEARAAAQAAERAAVACEKARLAAAAQVDALAARLAEVRAQLADGPTRAVAEQSLALLVEREAALVAARDAVGAAEAAAAALEGDAGHRGALEAERRAAATLSAAEAVAQRCETDLAAAARALEGRPAEAELSADLRLADELEAARVRAVAAEEAAEARASSASANVEQARAHEASARARYQATRDSLASLQPPAGSASLVDDWTVLAEWSEALADALSAEREQVVVLGRSLAGRRDEVRVRVRELAEHLVDRPDAPVDEVREQLVAAEATARAEAAQFERDLERVADARRRVAQLRADADVAKLLGDLLKASGFQRWLLEEAMNDLVTRATLRLHELTGGQYSLVADDGVFRVVDHRNADEVRDARSLSGGETFLTSLALALALADTSVDLAAEGTAPMESIFLDEGFGTLDPDTLDVVAVTIEELGASGRMVGIVTHIRELAERMPTRFEVTKGPSGSTITRVDQ